MHCEWRCKDWNYNEKKAAEEKLNQEDSSEEENGANKTLTENKKQVDFYPSVVHSLSEKDLKSPAVLKMLLSENKKHRNELDKLKDIEKKYHECDKDLAVVNEKLKKKTSSEILTDVVYTVGGLIIAISSLDFKAGISIHNGIFIIIGLVLIVGAPIAKWGKK